MCAAVCLAPQVATGVMLRSTAAACCTVWIRRCCLRCPCLRSARHSRPRCAHQVIGRIESNWDRSHLLTVILEMLAVKDVVCTESMYMMVLKYMLYCQHMTVPPAGGGGVGVQDLAAQVVPWFQSTWPLLASWPASRHQQYSRRCHPLYVPAGDKNPSCKYSRRC